MLDSFIERRSDMMRIPSGYSWGTTTFTYDNAGNLTTTKVPAGGLTTNTWDDLGRMSKVQLASGTRNTFTFNGEGLRVKREDSVGTLKQICEAR